MTQKRPRILVIDDDPLFRSLIVSLLRRDSLISVASEGSEGFYKALEHPPDLAVVDIQMPGWDGLRTLKAFRGHPALNDVKIVILTSDASKETVLTAVQGGANDYVIKTSFCKEDFQKKVEKLLCRDEEPDEETAESEETNSLPSANTAAPRMSPTAAHHAESSEPSAVAQDVLREDALDPAALEGAGLQEYIDAWE